MHNIYKFNNNNNIKIKKNSFKYTYCKYKVENEK